MISSNIMTPYGHDVKVYAQTNRVTATLSPCLMILSILHFGITKNYCCGLDHSVVTPISYFTNINLFIRSQIYSSQFHVYTRRSQKLSFPIFYANVGKWRQEKHTDLFGHESSIFPHNFQTCSGTCHNNH